MMLYPIYQHFSDDWRIFFPMIGVYFFRRLDNQPSNVLQ